jgi:DNA-binding CsgD family transcriptional regulator
MPFFALPERFLGPSALGDVDDVMTTPSMRSSAVRYGRSRRERHDLHVRQRLAQVGSDANPGGVGHRNVGDDDVGTAGPTHGKSRGAAAFRFPDDLHVGLRIDQQAQSLPDDAVIIDEEDARSVHKSSRGGTTGTRAKSVVPPSGCDSSCNEPPTATRSRMPRIPKRPVAAAPLSAGSTRHAEKAYVQQMLQNGANGYVLKQTAGDVLLEGIRTVMRGGTYLDPAVAGKLFEAASPARGGVAADITAREREVLTLVAFGHTNKEISSILGITVKTVESHKANAMQKLEIASRADLVRFALAQGWLDRH